MPYTPTLEPTQLARLPKYARDHIELLQRRLDEQINATASANVRAGLHADDPERTVFAPTEPHTCVRFDLYPDTNHRPDRHFMEVNVRKDGHLYVRSDGWGGNLAVLSGVSNAVELIVVADD